MSNPVFKNQEKTDWHGMPADEAIARLGSDRHHGLTHPEVQKRLRQFGRNRPAWLRFILQFHNALIYVMLVAAATTAFLGDWVDTGVLLAAVFVNAIIGFIQEAGDAVSLILAKEIEHNADLIVMGKHGESIVEEMLLGSVTRHVLVDSKCDVMIVR